MSATRPVARNALLDWLWSSETGMTSTDVDLHWQAFLRRFDVEHTFRMIKQTLGWTRPKRRSPEVADRWTWLVIDAHTQLRLTALGEARWARSPHSGPRLPRVQEPPPTPALPSPCAKTLNTRTRRTSWVNRIQPPAMTSARRPDARRPSPNATRTKLAKVNRQAEKPLSFRMWWTRFRWSREGVVAYQVDVPREVADAVGCWAAGTARDCRSARVDGLREEADRIQAELVAAELE